MSFVKLVWDVIVEARVLETRLTRKYGAISQ